MTLAAWGVAAEVALLALVLAVGHRIDQWIRERQDE